MSEQDVLDERTKAMAEALSDLTVTAQFAVLHRLLFRSFALGPDEGRMEFYVNFFGGLTAALCREGFLDEDQLGNCMRGGRVFACRRCRKFDI